jgi:hypothetical protein
VVRHQATEIARRLDRDACMISRLRHYQPEPDSLASEIVPPGSTAQGLMKRGDLSGKLIEKSCQEILGGYIRLTARLRT